MSLNARFFLYEETGTENSIPCELGGPRGPVKAKKRHHTSVPLSDDLRRKNVFQATAQADHPGRRLVLTSQGLR
jgi:hypothetical protein